MQCLHFDRAQGQQPVFFVRCSECCMIHDSSNFCHTDRPGIGEPTDCSWAYGLTCEAEGHQTETWGTWDGLGEGGGGACTWARCGGACVGDRCVERRCMGHCGGTCAGHCAHLTDGDRGVFGGPVLVSISFRKSFVASGDVPVTSVTGCAIRCYKPRSFISAWGVTDVGRGEWDMGRDSRGHTWCMGLGQCLVPRARASRDSRACRL